MTKKSFDRMAAQGDLLIVRVDRIPGNATPATSSGGRHIVAHSETGHHHWVRDTAEYFTVPDDPMTCYLRCSGPTDLVHDRPWDTHETITIPAGAFLLRRQREYTPKGWRRVED